jgi:molybdopterin-dependent oxidoreductase iron-sulfur protein
MKFSRRDLLVWGAGAAAGLVVTPVPWKLLDDTSKWSQNWPWIPQPARGPVEVKQSACTLCPNGCGLKVRMATGWPVGVAGVASHPITRGALCPLAFGAHQLNWHPDRLRTVRHRGGSASWEEARTAFAKACGEGRVVVVDGYPGRAASAVLETFAERRGEYRVVRGAETRALTPYEKWSGAPAESLGYDLENAATILSFGAPVLDGWGVPGRLTRLWAELAAGQAEPQMRVIQVESSLSRTSGRAYRWICIRPGSEAALARGIARVLLEEKLVPARGPMPDITLDEAASQTGLDATAIRELARTIVERPPVLAIATDDNPSVAALNVFLGAVGTRGGIVRRSKTTKPYASADAAIASARAVILDSSVPWNFVPQTDAEVFRFAAWNGGPTKADWLLPAPGFLEELTDVPTAPTFGGETYALAASLSKAAHPNQSCAQFLASMDPNLSSAEKIIHRRCEELFARRGNLHSREETAVAKIASAQKLEEQLWSGAVWVGEPASGESIRCALKQWPAADAGSPSDWSATWAAPVMPPLASKLYQESGLRESQGRNA